MDPDSKFGSIYNPDVVPFDSVSNLPCLALLGEPGIGKSTTMQSQKESIDKEVAERGDASLWIDLRAYQTDVRLVQALFEAPAFKSWVNGNHRLHLFLDSLDECLLRIDAVAALLIEEAHQTYAEFLAARYLLQQRMTIAQVMSLIVHPGDAERKLVPQLHETAAWVAGMMPDVFRKIVKTDPRGPFKKRCGHG